MAEIDKERFDTMMATMERERQKSNERNGQLRETVYTALNKVQAHIDMFHIEESKQHHLTNKCNELRALIDMYVTKR